MLTVEDKKEIGDVLKRALEQAFAQKDSHLKFGAVQPQPGDECKLPVWVACQEEAEGFRFLYTGTHEKESGNGNDEWVDSGDVICRSAICSGRPILRAVPVEKPKWEPEVGGLAFHSSPEGHGLGVVKIFAYDVTTSKFHIRSIVDDKKWMLEYAKNLRPLTLADLTVDFGGVMVRAQEGGDSNGILVIWFGEISRAFCDSHAIAMRHLLTIARVPIMPSDYVWPEKKP